MSHTYSITVRGFHCDLYGHVNNARYLEFMEDARWAYVAAESGMAVLEERGLGFIVAAINIQYKRPVGLGEVVEIRSHMARFEAKRAVMAQELFHQATGKVIAVAEVTFAVIDLATGRAVPMSDELRGWFTGDDPDGDPA